MIFEKQTTDLGRHYLYIHLRLDKEEVFYVGIGTKYKHGKDYSRAKAKGTQRNEAWRTIALSSEYKVIILFESDDHKTIKEKEMELISKYGRLSDNTGHLCNLSLGGDGCLGYRNKNIMKPVYIYLKSGEFFMGFESFADCAKYLKVADVSVGLSVNKNYLIKKYIIKDYKKDQVEPILDIKEKLKKRLSKPFISMI